MTNVLSGPFASALVVGPVLFLAPRITVPAARSANRRQTTNTADAPCLATPAALLQDRARVPAMRAPVELHSGRHDLRVGAVPVLIRRVVDAHILEPRSEVVLRLRGRRQAVRRGGGQVHLVDARDHLAP